MAQQIKEKIEILVKKLNLTNPDDVAEEYILTPEEEKVALDYAMDRFKKNYIDKHLQRGDPLQEVEKKMLNIDWDASIDRDGILKTCNSNKLYDVWIKDKRIKEKQQLEDKRAELKKMHTAKFFYTIMSWTSQNVLGKKLIVNPDNKHFISTICFFLSGDPRFETELGYSFKKGLLIRGISGIGKTFLMQCVKDNEYLPITIYSMIEISEKVQDEGYMELPATEGITYLDDVGTEEPYVKHFGTDINFFKNFIEKYYLNNKPFNRLIISTNNNHAELEKKYGFRVRSRIKDMFNIINVTGTDMRGN